MITNPKAGPAPFNRIGHKVCTHRISFHVSDNSIEMVVFFNRKRLKSSLIEMAQADALPSTLPTIRMSCCKPLKELGEFIWSFWPNNEMPVIWHNAERADPQIDCCQSFRKNCFKCRVVSRRGEETHSAHSPIEYVVHISGRRIAGGSRHVRRITTQQRGTEKGDRSNSPRRRYKCND